MNTYPPYLEPYDRNTIPFISVPSLMSNQTRSPLRSYEVIADEKEHEIPFGDEDIPDMDSADPFDIDVPDHSPQFGPSVLLYFTQ